MGRKKKAPEHENLERWLVSYADFMTLLFATFVVLYALSQVDASDFAKLEDALKRAFQSNVFEGQESIMDSSSSFMEGQDGANPILLEYLSPKYEEAAYQEIKEELDKSQQEGIETTIDDRGLVIKLANNALVFESGSAKISTKSYVQLNMVARLIRQRFQIHVIKVEGHTDSDPTSSTMYPSNWELSTARASSVIRYFIGNYNFNPKLFIATGYADTVPVSNGNTLKDKEKNRRVEIVILRNKHRKTSGKNLDELLKQKPQKLDKNVSEAAQKLVGEDKKLMDNVIDFKQTYTRESERIDEIQSIQTEITPIRPDFLE